MKNIWVLCHSRLYLLIITQGIYLSLLNYILVSAGEPPSDNHKNVFKMSMPNVTTSTPDGYLCTAFDIRTVSNTPIYVTGFHPDAEALKAHHMLLHTCNVPYKQEKGSSWDCMMAPTCQDQASIIYGWARNADNLKLPDGVSFTLDPEEKNYLVLQVHYAEVIKQPDSSGITLELSQKP